MIFTLGSHWGEHSRKYVKQHWSSRHCPHRCRTLDTLKLSPLFETDLYGHYINIPHPDVGIMWDIDYPTSLKFHFDF